jgi:hypothetical protein
MARNDVILYLTNNFVTESFINCNAPLLNEETQIKTLGISLKILLSTKDIN